MTLEVIPSDAFVIHADGADESLEVSLKLRSAEADSKARYW